MAFLTDRKLADRTGSAKTGTEHHWHMTVTSVALAVLVPLFVFIVGPMLGTGHDEVVARFERPFPAIVAALTIVAGFSHFNGGVQTLIEDYVHGIMRKALIIAAFCLSYAAAAIGIFAIARIAL